MGDRFVWEAAGWRWIHWSRIYCKLYFPMYGQDFVRYIWNIAQAGHGLNICLFGRLGGAPAERKRGPQP